MTRQVAALETSGLVRRSRDPQDGRVSRIELTPLGTRRMTEVREGRVEKFGRLLAGWSDEDLARFGDLLARFNDAIRPAPAETR